MKVVIDIPEDDYKLACNYPDALIACYAHYIKEGTVLPNNHGRLIDYDWVVGNVIKKLGIKDKQYLLQAEKALMILVDDAPTVIEAEDGDTDETE